jgi:hypothetical protein
LPADLIHLRVVEALHVAITGSDESVIFRLTVGLIGSVKVNDLIEDHLWIHLPGDFYDDAVAWKDRCPNLELTSGISSIVWTEDDRMLCEW